VEPLPKTIPLFRNNYTERRDEVMKRYLNIIRALVEGKALVITKSPNKEKSADVLVGKNLSKDFTVSSLMSTLKAIVL
jgi:hypothetical protein